MDPSAGPTRDTVSTATVDAGESLLLVLTTVDDEAAADRIAQALVAERLVACVNVLAPCRSVYRWRGQVERTDEWPLLIKTRASLGPALARRLAEIHPYEVPELVAWRPSDVAPAYLAWALGETNAAPAGPSAATGPAAPLP